VYTRVNTPVVQWSTKGILTRRDRNQPTIQSTGLSLVYSIFYTLPYYHTFNSLSCHDHISKHPSTPRLLQKEASIMASLENYTKLEKVGEGTFPALITIISLHSITSHALFESALITRNIRSSLQSERYPYKRLCRTQENPIRS
jgi:hypothetical protein